MITISTLTKCLSDDLKGDYRGSHLDGRSSELHAAFGLLQDSLSKKFLASKMTTPEMNKAALDKFLQCNLHCKNYELTLNTSGDEELYGTFKQELYDFFYPRGMPLLESLDQIWDSGRNGPGASIGSPHGSAYAKLWGSRLSVSKSILLKHFQERIQTLPLWNSAENFRRLARGPSVMPESSRLSFVPKNDRIARTICTEPVLNMFYQLGIGSLLTWRLFQVFGISLENQAEVNRALANAGSIDGSISTIDLESASDTISLNLLKDCIPREQLAWLMACRSDITTAGGHQHVLHMISSMGNGFTFPLQTVIFACAVRAVYRSLGIHRRIAVFGDDIACESRSYHRLVRFLAILGFKVNTQKSFSEGPFRESCGWDCFKGSLVRGVYVKALSNPAEIYVAMNRLIDWSVQHRFPLWSTIRSLMRCLPRIHVIPLGADASGGWRVPLCVARMHVGRDRNGSMRYKQLEWVPDRMSIHAGRVPGSGRRILYNPDGLLLSALHGETVAQYLTSRDVGRWKTKRRVSPNWDFPYESSGTTTWRAGLCEALSDEFLKV